MPPPLAAANHDAMIRYMKRGGGGPPDPSQTSFAPTPPASTMRHGKPTIAGSEGGFIGLVVGLGILFIGCSIGVWFLLRRRHKLGRRPIQILGNVGNRKAEAERSGPGGGAFGRLGSRDGHGWQRTGDDSDDEGGGHPTATEVKLTKVRSRSPAPPSTAESREREGLYSNDSNPFASQSTTRFQDHTGPYDDAFEARPSTDSLDEAVHSSLPSHSNQPRSGAPPSFISPPVSPKFDSGTKFKEGF